MRELAQERESNPLNDQVPGVSGVTELEKHSQDSEQSLASNERDQVSSLSKQVPDICTVPESESNQGLHHQNELFPSGYLVPSNADDLEIIVHESEQNNVNQNHTPPRPSSSLLNLSQDCLALEDCDIEDYIFDNTELSLPSLISLKESQNQNLEKETPTKFLHQASPIPRIPLSITKRSKQSAEILNSNDKIAQKKNKAENIKKTNKITKTKITTETKKNKPSGDKKSIEKKKRYRKKRKSLKNILI